MRYTSHAVSWQLLQAFLANERLLHELAKTDVDLQSQLPKPGTRPSLEFEHLKFL